MSRFRVGFAPYGVPVYGTPADMGGYDLKISEDDTKFLYTK